MSQIPSPFFKIYDNPRSILNQPSCFNRTVGSHPELASRSTGARFGRALGAAGPTPSIHLPGDTGVSRPGAREGAACAAAVKGNGRRVTWWGSEEYINMYTTDLCRYRKKQPSQRLKTFNPPLKGLKNHILKGTSHCIELFDVVCWTSLIDASPKASQFHLLINGV